MKPSIEAIKSSITELKECLQTEEELMEALDRFIDKNSSGSFLLMEKLEVFTLYSYVVRQISERRRCLTKLFQQLEDAR